MMYSSGPPGSMAEAREIAMQFPRLRVRLKTADYAASPDNSFEFGLQAILDGLETQLIVSPHARRPARAQATRDDQEPVPGPVATHSSDALKPAALSCPPIAHTIPDMAASCTAHASRTDR